MNKSLIIDFNLLEELNISVNQFLFLYNLYSDDNIFKIIITDDEEKYLENKKLLKIVNGICYIRQESIDIIELLTVETSNKVSNKKEVKKSNRIISEDVNNRIEEFRNLWKGLKAGSMGSLKSCKDKMTRWMKENPEYSFDEIIEAAKLYLRTEGMNLRFLQRADYFIYKQSNNREEESRLSAYIDDIDNNDDEDWTSTLN